MKKLMLILAFAAFGTYAAQAQTATPAAQTAKPVDKKAPKFKFEEETHDFGTLPDGPDATTEFSFKNVGKEPLIITQASASCGCTVPEWPKEPILPGKKGTIKVTFHTAGKSGQPFSKTVYINSNAATDKDRYEIYIKGNVAPATATPAPATPVKG